MGELLKRGFIFLKIGQDKACAKLAAELRGCCANATGSTGDEHMRIGEVKSL
jgi:hypothetical protein